jgi:uncharacterized protein (DUF305 family)
MQTGEIMTLNTRAFGALALGLALGLTGCSSTDNADDSAAETTTSTSEHNAADVEFATDMIPHHAQALVMVDMTQGRTMDPEFEKLTTDIRDAQGPEIELMTDWLVDWDEEIPATMRDHTNAGGGMGEMDDGGMGEMPGMMSDEDFDGLENASATTFQDMWLAMMIEHHEGAIEMARTEVSDGLYQPTVELAEQIIISQTAEIALMREMLG